MGVRRTKPIMNRLLSAIADSEADGTQHVFLTKTDALDAVKRITKLLVALSEAHSRLHELRQKRSCK